MAKTRYLKPVTDEELQEAGASRSEAKAWILIAACRLCTLRPTAQKRLERLQFISKSRQALTERGRMFLWDCYGKGE